MIFDWSSTPVRVGAFLLTLASGSLLNDLLGNVPLTIGLAGFGLLLMIAGTWWWKRGFQFPDSLDHRIVVREESPRLVWGIDLDMLNPGRTDEFDVRIEKILGAKAPTSAIGAYPKWRGHTSGDKKLIRRGDRATLALCTWEPSDLQGVGEFEYESVTSTVHASTGDTPVELTAAGAAYDKLDRYELVYRLRITSDRTERQTRYDVHVGVQSAFNYAPQVDVVRQEDGG